MISIYIDCNAAVPGLGLDWVWTGSGLGLDWVWSVEDQKNEGGEVRPWSKKLVMEGWG